MPCAGSEGDADAALELEEHALELERLGERHARSRRATSRAASSSRTPDSSTANSSPPSRATVSSGRTASRSRCATICRSRSPVVVAQGVVDLLEPVEVEDEQARRTAGPRPVLQARPRAGPRGACGSAARSGCRGWPGARGRGRGRPWRRSRSSAAAPAAATPAPGSMTRATMPEKRQHGDVGEDLVAEVLVEDAPERLTVVEADDEGDQPVVHDEVDDPGRRSSAARSLGARSCASSRATPASRRPAGRATRWRGTRCTDRR